MKALFYVLALSLTTTAAHASMVFTSSEARALTLPASIEIASAVLDLSQGAPALVLTGQDFISNRFPARLLRNSENRIDAIMNIVLPRLDGRGCGEFESATIRVIAPNLELPEDSKTIEIDPELLMVFGIHDYAPDSCHSQHQLRSIQYTQNHY